MTIWITVTCDLKLKLEVILSRTLLTTMFNNDFTCSLFKIKFQFLILTKLTDAGKQEMNRKPQFLAWSFKIRAQQAARLSSQLKYLSFSFNISITDEYERKNLIESIILDVYCTICAAQRRQLIHKYFNRKINTLLLMWKQYVMRLHIIPFEWTLWTLRCLFELFHDVDFSSLEKLYFS